MPEDCIHCERIIIGDGYGAKRIALTADLLREAAEWCDQHPGRIVRDVVVDIYSGYLTLYIDIEEGRDGD